MAYYFIMRHGEAEMRAATDAERELTSYGVAYTRQIAGQLSSFIQSKGLDKPIVIHSPFVRARQTAREVVEAFNSGVSLVTLDLATPDDSAEECFHALEAYSGKSFILVSHMPLVASLASYFEHANLYSSHGFHTSEVRAYQADLWAPGCGIPDARFY